MNLFRNLILSSLIISVAATSSEAQNDVETEIERAERIRSIRSNIAKGANVNKLTPEGVPAIIVAVGTNDMDGLEIILEHPDLNVNARSLKHQQTALMTAVRLENEVAIETLLKHPETDVDLTDDQGYTALHYAVRGNLLKIASLLLPRVKQINAASSNSHNTALHLAVYAGNLEMIYALLAHEGIDVNARDREGRTPIHLAAKNGKNLILSVLMSQDGVDVNAADDGGETPLHLAVIEGHSGTVENVLLRNRKVKLNVVDKFNETPLHKAVGKGFTPIFAALLRHKKAAEIINIANLEGETILMLAAKHGNVNIIMMLVRFPELLVNLKNIDGNTALHLAVINYHSSPIVPLLNHPQIDEGITNADGKTALQLANTKKHEAIRSYWNYNHVLNRKK